MGNAYFSSILADTKARARKAPELLREVLAAADKAAELDGVSARNKVWWPIVKAVVRATVKVVGAVNQRDQR